MISINGRRVDTPEVTQSRLERNAEGGLRLSASQIEAWLACQRKWAWRYIAKVPDQEKESTKLGKAVHKELEKYLKGEPIDFSRNDNAGYIAASGTHLLPKPKSPGLKIEEQFHFFGQTKHSYLGYKDLEYPGHLTGHTLDVVLDHKTTKDFVWQKKAADLETGIQSNIYATDYFRTHPDQPEVQLRWSYYRTTGARKSALTEVVVNQERVWEQFQRIEKIAQEIDVVAKRADEYIGDNINAFVLSLPETIDSCSAYGGCQYQGLCNISPMEKIRALAEQDRKRLHLVASTPTQTPTETRTPQTQTETPTKRTANMGMMDRLNLANGTNGAPPPPPAAPVPGPAASATSAAPVPSMLGRLGMNRATQVAPAAAPVAAAPPATGGIMGRLAVHAAAGPQVAPPAAAVPVPVAPGQINPPEWQPPPSAEQLAAGTPGAPAAEKKTRKKATADVPSAAAIAAAVPAQPRKVTDPPVQNIGVLYIDCGPVGTAAASVVDASAFISAGKSKLAEGSIADWRYVDYGKGAGALAEAVGAALDTGTWPAIRVDTTTAEWTAIGFEFVSRAQMVVR